MGPPGEKSSHHAPRDEAPSRRQQSDTVLELAWFGIARARSFGKEKQDFARFLQKMRAHAQTLPGSEVPVKRHRFDDDRREEGSQGAHAEVVLGGSGERP